MKKIIKKSYIINKITEKFKVKIKKIINHKLKAKINSIIIYYSI